jgi:hypothetical protein
MDRQGRMETKNKTLDTERCENTDTFRNSRIYFSIRRDNICEHTVNMACVRIHYLLRSRKISVSFETYDLSFHVFFSMAFILKRLHFFAKNFHSLYLFLCYPYFGTFPFHDIPTLVIKLLV